MLANNNATDKETVRLLTDIRDGHLDEPRLLGLISSKSIMIAMSIASSPNLTPLVARRLFAARGRRVRARLIQDHGDLLEPEQLREAAESGDIMVRHALAEVSRDPALLGILASDGDTRVLLALARNHHLGEDIQRELSFHPSIQVGRTLAANRSLRVSDDFSASWLLAHKPELFEEMTHGLDSLTARTLGVNWSGTLLELRIAATAFGPGTTRNP